jgi:GR25 family glycosyltransferase involved in LPS biosynthesis
MRMLQREGVDVQPFDAVKPTPEMIAATVAPEKLDKFTKGMVGCSLSHRALWAELLTQPAGSTMLIFEDDVQLPNHHDGSTPLVDQIAEFMKGVPEDWDIVFLGRCWDNCLKCKRVNKNTVQTKNALCLHAYALNQTAARALLGSNSPQTLAVDEDVQRLLREDRIKAYAKTPQMLQQDPRIESTSQLNKYLYQPECRGLGLELPALIGVVMLALIIVVVCVSVSVVCVRKKKRVAQLHAVW